VHWSISARLLLLHQRNPACCSSRVYWWRLIRALRDVLTQHPIQLHCVLLLPCRIAEQLLLAQAQELGLLASSGSSSSSSSSSSGEQPASGEAPSLPTTTPTPPPGEVFSVIYAVGDNPAADVRGANSAGQPWVSVLVRTGVFQGPPASNSLSDPAHIVVEDVLGAVQAAFHRSRSQRWHSMR
jgi:hypothetical protein